MEQICRCLNIGFADTLDLRMVFGISMRCRPMPYQMFLWDPPLLSFIGQGNYGIFNFDRPVPG